MNVRDSALPRTPHVTTRLPTVGTTIFTVMSRLAADVGAINLSQGFPDFDCDPALIEAVAEHMRRGQNQYAPMQGVLRLREAIAAKFASAGGRQYDAETRRLLSPTLGELISANSPPCTFVSGPEPM